MAILSLGLREFRANWRRNSVFGAILFISILVQLFTTMSASASHTAVETYGAAVFGYEETYSMSLEEPLSVEQLRAFNHQLEVIGLSYPWFRPATAVDIPGYLRVSPVGSTSDVAPLTLRAVSSSWRLLTPSIVNDDVWRTVTSNQRLGAAVMLESSTAQRLRILRPMAVTMLVDEQHRDGNAADRSSQGTRGTSSARPTPSASENPYASQEAPFGDGAPPDASNDGVDSRRVDLPDVPVFGTYSELNKSLAADALVNQNLLALAHLGPQATQVYWRCLRLDCRDTYGLIQTAAAAIGVRPGRYQRIDQLDQFRPILQQQHEDGQTFAVVVLILGTLAVAIVSAAFVEVRAPQFATLRALGASRPAVGAIALLENLFTALLVGAVAVLLGVAASYVDPNRFNRISQIHLDHVSVPVILYAQTVALTLVIGLLTGLAPALRAYRSVRTS